jgi:hypothetical protein
MSTPISALPFTWDADIVGLSGSTITPNVPVSIWPAPTSTSEASGETYDHTSEAPLRLIADLDQPNRSLKVHTGPYTGMTFRIVSAAAQTFLPHVTLQLIRTRAGG